MVNDESHSIIPHSMNYYSHDHYYHNHYNGYQRMIIG